MAFPVTLNGTTYTLADFEGTNYVDGFPNALEDFVTQAGDIYNSTSTSSVAIGTGSKTFTTADSGKPYQAGTPLRIADAAAPETNFMDAIVTSYSGTTLVVDVFGYAGSGTKTSWTINIGGAKTVDGTLAISQGGTGATSAADARTNIDVYSKAEADSKFLDVSGEASNVTMTGDVTIGDTAGDTLTVNAAATFVNGVSFGDNVISGDDIDGGTISNFASTGIDDNATSTAITIDSSENVGIGTLSPDALLNLEATQNPVLRLGSSDGTVQVGDILGTVEFYSNDTNAPGVGAKIYAEQEDQNGAAEAAIVFETGVTGALAERLRINSDGLIGIGTDNPAKNLHIHTDAGDEGILIKSTGNTSNAIISDANRSSAGAAINNLQGKWNGTAVADILFLTGADTTNKDDGVITFRTSSADNITERARIDSSGHLIVPNGVTLGTAAGTYAAANTLDDYEEGTWTPVFNTGYSSLTYVARTGVYTKIGNMVELKFFLQVTGTTASGNLTITGLPFSSGANAINNNVGIIHVQTNSGTLTTDSPICRLGASSTTIHVQTQGTTSINSMAGSELGNGIINGSITYFTS